MKRVFPTLCLLFISLLAFAQQVEVEGRVLDPEGNPISFTTVLLKQGDEVIQGTATAENGRFMLEAEPGTYMLDLSHVGWQQQEREIKIDQATDLGHITLQPAAEELDEAVVRAKSPTVTKENGKLTFEVENSSLSSGSTLNLLQKTPGVLVIQNQITVKNAPTVVYINDRRVYLSASETAALLTNLDASVVKSIEVITDPPAYYDAEGGAVLNIITSKSISIGYKGNAGVTYEQAVYAKYNLNTAHFYKNEWVDLYASYSYSPRKAFKQQDDNITYFEPDGSVNSFWESDFERTTRSKAHQLGVIADFTLSPRHDLNFTANLAFGPDEDYDNRIRTDIQGSDRVLDSLFTTASLFENNRDNLSFQLQHKVKLGEEEQAEMTTSVNYIHFDQQQDQGVRTQYFLPGGDFLNQNRFFTNAGQETDIITAGVDLDFGLGEFSARAGLKYSDISTDSFLDFFNANAQPPMLQDDLSDLFLYDESIYAAYFQLERSWEDWSLDAGLRAEQTNVNGDSRALGLVNTQDYFELFPTLSLSHNLNEKNVLGLRYARRISRPRYQSLNPFKYFINETNFNAGNPALRPEINNKVTLSYAYDNTFFVEAYYEHSDNTLSTLVFQDNQDRIIRTVDTNLIQDFQYSLDFIYSASVSPWWYLYVLTSTFYLENEFFAEESPQLTYSNSTPGFFGQLYNSFTLDKNATWTADLTGVYLSNYIFGSYEYKNQFSLSLSFRKSLWEGKANLTVGVDDIFNTNNIEVASRYLNQDNSYFARPESRMFRASFTYNFGNWNLGDNQRTIDTTEGDRLD